VNQSEEDALKALVDKMAQESGYGGIGMDTMYGEFAFDVARAAVAQERERAAKCADEHAKRDFTWGSENSDRYHAQADWAERIAAAIRRGE